MLAEVSGLPGKSGATRLPLEKKGVKIVVTTKEAYNVKGKAPVAAPTDDSKTAGATDITASSSAGCK
jgi:hypothetical protein